MRRTPWRLGRVGVVLAILLLLAGVLFFLWGPMGMVQLFNLRDLQTTSDDAMSPDTRTLPLPLLREGVTRGTLATVCMSGTYFHTAEETAEGLLYSYPVAHSLELVLTWGTEGLQCALLVDVATGDRLDVTLPVPAEVFDAFVRAHE